MRKMSRKLSGMAIVNMALMIGCSHASSNLAVSAGTGPDPVLPRPQKSTIPLINVASASSWAPNASPLAAPGLEVRPFAQHLQHPRWLLVLANGDVLVAETNAPVRPKDATGIRGWFFRHYQKKGGGTAPSANRILLLRDADGDGIADRTTVFLDGLNSPFGMSVVGDRLYIANTDAIVSVPYASGDTVARAHPETLVQLPAGERNHHWTKSLVTSPDGRTLYVGVGSNSNVGENGIEPNKYYTIDSGIFVEVGEPNKTKTQRSKSIQSKLGTVTEAGNGNK